MTVTNIIRDGSSTVDTAVGVELAQRILAGDARAEDELVRLHQRGVFIILRHATRDDELARDLCQDTFVIVLKRLRAAPLDDPTRLAGFIAQTARNLAIGTHRRDARRRTESDSDAIDAAADPQSAREEAGEVESSASAVRRLLLELKSQRDRTAIVRYYLDEEDKKKICADLGMNELQFNVVLFRARERLKQLLEQSGLRKTDLLCLALV